MKKKTPDQLKETISKQQGEIARLKRELEEQKEITLDAQEGQNDVQHILNEVKLRGRHAIDAANASEDVRRMDLMFVKLSEEVICALEDRERQQLNTAQSLRRLALQHDLGFAAVRPIVIQPYRFG